MRSTPQTGGSLGGRSSGSQEAVQKQCAAHASAGQAEPLNAEAQLREGQLDEPDERDLGLGEGCKCESTTVAYDAGGGSGALRASWVAQCSWPSRVESRQEPAPPQWPAAARDRRNGTTNTLRGKRFCLSPVHEKRRQEEHGDPPVDHGRTDGDGQQEAQRA